MTSIIVTRALSLIVMAYFWSLLWRANFVELRAKTVLIAGAIFAAGLDFHFAPLYAQINGMQDLAKLVDLPSVVGIACYLLILVLSAPGAWFMLKHARYTRYSDHEPNTYFWSRARRMIIPLTGLGTIMLVVYPLI